MKKTIPLLAILMAELCLATPLVAATARTATENFITSKIAAAISQIPPPDYSTNNVALVETIEAKAPTPDLSPFLRNDGGAVDIQEFGGVLFGRYWANSWSDYTAVDGRVIMQTLPSYIESNPWNFLKQGEAIPTTGGVFNAYIHLNQKFSVGTWTQYVKPIESAGGSGIAFAFGDNVQTRAANTMVLGVGALNTNNWSFIWNGDANRIYVPTQPNISNPYSTRYNGGFHVNPSVRTGMTNPLQNFWIGDTNLATWISTLAPAPGDYAAVSNAAMNALSRNGGTVTLSNGFFAVGYDDYGRNAGFVPCIAVDMTGVDPIITIGDDYAGHGGAGETYFRNPVRFRDYASVDFEHGFTTYGDRGDHEVYVNGQPQYVDYALVTDITPAISNAVPAWALEAQKPTYTASEVGATSPTAVSNIVTAAYINDRVNVSPLAGRTYNFATNIGLYTAVRDIIQALGGSVTNFPAIPQN